MPENYSFNQLLTDMMSVVMEGSPVIVAAGCLLAAVGFVFAWFFYAVRGIVDWPFKR